MRFLFVMLALLGSQLSWASTEKRTFCIYDPLGSSGNLFAIGKDYREYAVTENIDFHLRAYTDEKIASDDFKAGQCDMVLLTGTRSRPFNKFGATVEALGAVPSTGIMKQLVRLTATPKAAKYMVDTDGRYEVAGILPAGPVYLFVNDREIDTIEELSGKRMATLEYDEAAMSMVSFVGASIVPSNSANFAGKFNNGSAEMTYAPAFAYEPLEIFKGIGDNGGVIRFNLAYLDFQAVIHKDRFPEGFGQRSRQQFASYFDKAVKAIDLATASIDEKLWIDLPAADMQAYNELFREVRVKLRDEGIYHPKMLSLMRKLRCRENPAAAECVEKLE